MFANLWDRLGPRERRLLGLLGVALVVCTVGYTGFLIQDGLATLEEQNAETRALLRMLEERREDLMTEKKNDAVTLIGDEATPLATYLEKIASETGVTIKNQSEKPAVAKGKFQELSTEIRLVDVTLEQLAKFLRSIETTSPIVVTRHLSIKRSFMQKEKLDNVTIQVATYRRTPNAAKTEETKP